MYLSWSTARTYFITPIYATLLLTLLFATSRASADVQVTSENTSLSESFEFKAIPRPAINDLATSAKLRVVDGKADVNSGDVQSLVDAVIPESADDPRKNFFFAQGSAGGRIEFDFGEKKKLSRIASYSWHVSSRSPQCYTLYGATGDADKFTRELAKGVDPAKNGWSLIATVDTRKPGEAVGGQQGVSIIEPKGSLGEFRYLLFDVVPTETLDPFGNTFLSEIDVFEANGAEPITIAAPQTTVLRFSTEDGKFDFTVDVTNALDLRDWTERELRPVILTWYPKIVDMFPSDGFVAARQVKFRYLDGNTMKGVPAYAAGSEISLNNGWFRRELQREARGAVVHEMVHVVQRYGGGARGGRRPARVPGWIVEGIPDYVRWFLYEPETKGAEMNARNIAAPYDSSYRVSGNFIDWVTKQYDEALPRKLNAIARDGRYSTDFWKEVTGKTEQELSVEWKTFHKNRLGIE